MKLLAVILAVVLGLSGCATSVTTIPQDHALGNQNESVVFGRVAVELLQPPLDFFANLGRMRMIIRNETTDKDYAVICDRTGLDSEFYVSLPPGRYRFVNIMAMNVESELPPGQFEIGTGRVQYLGTMRFQGQSVPGSGMWRVDDESEKAVQSFRERYPRLSPPAAKSVIEGWSSAVWGGWRMAGTR